MAHEPLQRIALVGFGEVGGIFGRGRKARVLEVIHTGGKAPADLLRPVRVRHHRQMVLVRLVHYGAHLVHGHLVLIDQLDDVDAGRGEALHLGAGIRFAIHTPAEPLRSGVGRVLDERA